MGLLSRVINSFVQKAPDDKEYIRTVDIAPHGFNEYTNEYQVNASESEKTKVLKAHLNFNGLITSEIAYLGEDSRPSGIHQLKPIDVSRHARRTVVIYNYHDQPIKFRTPFFFVDFDQTHREILPEDYPEGSASNFTVPAFNTQFNVPGKLMIDGLTDSFLDIKLPGLGLDLRQSDTAPTTGYIDVYVLGGK